MHLNKYQSYKPNFKYKRAMLEDAVVAPNCLKPWYHIDFLTDLSRDRAAVKFHKMFIINDQCDT